MEHVTVDKTRLTVRAADQNLDFQVESHSQRHLSTWRRPLIGHGPRCFYQDLKIESLIQIFICARSLQIVVAKQQVFQHFTAERPLFLETLQWWKPQKVLNEKKKFVAKTAHIRSGRHWYTTALKTVYCMVSWMVWRMVSSGCAAEIRYQYQQLIHVIGPIRSTFTSNFMTLVGTFEIRKESLKRFSSGHCWSRLSFESGFVNQ